MSYMDISTTKKEEIEKLILQIAGYEQAIQMAGEDELKFTSVLRRLQKATHVKLREVVYGLYK